MAEAVTAERAGRVAVLRLQAGPVNALGAALRAALFGQLAAAVADPDVGAIVLCAAGRIFSAGADIAEFAMPPAPDVPDLSALCLAVEASPKPVVAAIQGAALGGGLELALACHVRLAGPAARMGFPEVALGLLPGAGGTQRAPRLIGPAAALEMMLGGQPVDAAAAEAMGLVDGVVPDALEAAAVALAADLAAEGRPPARTRDRRGPLRDVAGWQAAVAAAREAQGAAARLPAPARIVDCVEAALLLPFDQGLAFERAAFEDLRASPQSAGLRHMFLAERRAARFAEAAVPPRDVAEVGVVGLGRTGAALVARCLRAGIGVSALAADSGALVAGLGRVADLQERDVLNGTMTAAERDAAWERLVPAADVVALDAADLVIEALPEDEALKARVLGELVTRRPGRIIASSTGWLDPARLAATSRAGGGLVGLAVQVDGAAVAELGVGPDTAPEAVATVAAVMRRLGLQPVRTGAAPGLIGARVTAALGTAADLLVEAGATPWQVDDALSAFGFAAGVYAARDATGLDREWTHRQRQGGVGAGGDLVDLLVTAGRLGTETGRGYYRHEAGATPAPDPEVTALLAEVRAAKGIVPRRVGSAEICLRCLAAAANEGARAVGEGVAVRPSDVDVVMVGAYGFPRWEGGPMHWAAARGLLVLRADLHRFAAEGAEAGAFWAPAPLIDTLIREGRTLSDLDRASA